MAEELRVQISAETKELTKALKKSEKNLDSFGKKVTSSGNTTNKFGKQVKGNAVPAMQEFSRVIQDAPFGIQGVANNITQLTTQFGNLSKNAGGTKAALKAMLGTLAGPAGILLAVSAVTSLLVSFGDKLQFAANQTSKLAEATKKYVGEARAEISTLNTLFSIATNENNSKTQRLGAINKLNEKYGKYLGNLDLEKVKTDQVANSVKNLTLAILQRAKLQGVQDLITEATADASEDLVKAELDRQKALDKVDTQIQKVIKGNAALRQELEGLNRREAVARLQQLSKQNTLLGDAARKAGVGVAIAVNEFKDASATVKELNNDLNNTLKPLVRLEQDFTKNLFNFEANATINPNVTVDQQKLAESSKRAFQEGFNALQAGGTFDNISFGENAESSIALGLQADLAAANLARGQFLANQVAFEEAYKASLARINEETNLKTSLVTSAFTNLGQNIANALGQTQGLFGAFVGTIIQESLKLVQQLVINSIKGAAATKSAAAAQVASAKVAAAASAVQAGAASAAAAGPGAAFVLPGLIAGALAAVSAAFGNIGGGGGASSGAGGSGSVNNSSAVNTSFGSGLGSGDQRVVFQISGRNLLGVLQNEIGAANRINGQNIETISLG